MIRIYGLATHTNKERTSGVDFLRIIQPLKHLAKEEGFKVDIYNPHEKEPTHWRDVAPKYDIIYFNYLTMDWGYAAMG
ncbi:hypothetical protein FJZ33_09790, partial [Candidatus Poribacteria bacterium]|nr:hypothetical protein [Candidatus Poribacteria bacterium]